MAAAPAMASNWLHRRRDERRRVQTSHIIVVTSHITAVTSHITAVTSHIIVETTTAQTGPQRLRALV